MDFIRQLLFRACIWIVIVSPGIYSISLLFVQDRTTIAEIPFLSSLDAFSLLFKDLLTFETRLFSAMEGHSVHLIFISLILVAYLLYDHRLIFFIMAAYFIIYLVVGYSFTRQILDFIPPFACQLVGYGLVASFFVTLS